MVFLIQAHPSLDTDLLDCDFGRVVIGPKQAEELLALGKIFKAAWKASTALKATLWEIYYWDMAGQIDFISFSKLYEHVGKAVEKMDPELKQVPFKTFEGMTSIGITAVKRESTEVEQLIVRGNGVAWTALVKHTQVYVTTETIPWSRIRSIAKKRQQKQVVRRAGSTSKSRKS